MAAVNLEMIKQNASRFLFIVPHIILQDESKVLKWDGGRDGYRFGKQFIISSLHSETQFSAKLLKPGL